MRMLTNIDVRPYHRTAVLATVDVVSGVTNADLGRPTPCAEWDLGALLAHMTIQHRGFAAAAQGHGADPTVWDVATVTDAVRTDPTGTYAAAAHEVIAAFAADGVLDASFDMPEFGPGVSVPGAQAIQFHFVDYVVHGWDVARALGVPFELPGDVVRAAAPIVFAVPDGDIRTAPNAPFAPALPAADHSGDLDRMLRHLGRSPQWTP